MKEEKKPIELTPAQEQMLDEFAFYNGGVITYLATQVSLVFLTVSDADIRCYSCGAVDNISFWHPDDKARPICLQCSQCGTTVFQKRWYQKFYEKQKRFKERIEKGEKMPEVMEEVLTKVENEMKKQEAKSVEFLCDYIEEHASQIYIREYVNGQLGSYALTELPASLAVKHTLRFIKEGGMPTRKKEEDKQ